MLGCFGFCLVIGYCENYFPRYNSPGELVEAVVRGYQSQNNTLLEACYGKSRKQLRGDMEINFQKKFYLSVDAKAVNINKTEELFSMGNYYCMGVSFDFLLKDRKSLPYYEYYFVHKTGGTYKVLTKLECPRALLDAFEEKKDNMQESALYREYEKQTVKFTSGNPASAEQIYGRFQELLEGPPAEMEKNLSLVCGVFLMAIAELGIVCVLIYLFRLMKHLQNTARPLSGKNNGSRISGKSVRRRFRNKYSAPGTEKGRGRQRTLNRTPVNTLQSTGSAAAARSGRGRLPHPHTAARSQMRSGKASIFDGRKDNIPHTGTQA